MNHFVVAVISFFLGNCLKKKKRKKRILTERETIVSFGTNLFKVASGPRCLLLYGVSSAVATTLLALWPWVAGGRAPQGSSGSRDRDPWRPP